LFLDDNPFVPPPHDLDYMGDINTSKAYIKSYRKYIPRKIPGFPEKIHICPC
jgi:hypothetical protein